MQGHRWLADQLPEKRPVMNHCLAQFFRAGFSSSLPQSDFVSLPIVLQNQGMTYGDIGRPLLKITHRIASRGHHIAEQSIRFRDRAGRVVHEMRLDFAPGLCEARPIGCRERPHVEPFHALCARVERSFRMSPAAVLLDRTIIFGAAELSAQFGSPVFPVENDPADEGHENRDEHNDYGHFACA